MKAQSNLFRTVLTHTIFPFILFGNISALVLIVQKHGELASLFNYLLISNLIVLYVLEKLLTFKASWSMTAREFLRDVGYFGFNGLIDACVKIGLGFIVISYASPTQILPLWLSSILAILIVEFFGYWYHRLGHVNHFLWKIHSIHHVPNKVNLLNNNTANFLNIAFGTGIKLLPLVLFGFNIEAVFIAVSLTTIHSYVVHMNADIKGGWLNTLFLSPEHHRFHHSTNIEEAGNFAVLLTVWDRIFGTYVFEEGKTPVKIGVQNEEMYPKPFQLIQGFLFPFTDKKLW